MPKFLYIVKDSQGKSYRNVVEDSSQKSLVDKLQKQNYFIISVKEVSSGAFRKKKKKTKKFTHTKIKLRDKLIFARQLATMLKAGITLTRAITIILSQVQSQGFYKVLTIIKDDVEQGATLSAGLAKHPKIFNPFWVSLIEVGEASGNIPSVLNKLVEYLEQQEAFNAIIVSSLIYPLILFCVSMGAVGFFALFVGPRFQNIFDTMGVDLPFITIALLATFDFIKKYILFIIGGFAAIIFMLWQYSKTYNGKTIFEIILFNTPTFGEIFNLIIVERFCSQMAMLIDAGVPILYALDICERLVNNNTCAIIIGNIKDGIKEGELLVTPMERSNFFPPMTVQMIMVGEETGELSSMLQSVSKFYKEHIETFMKRFATVIEPVMLVFMGAIIGTVVVAMFLPIFNIAKLGGAGGG